MAKCLLKKFPYNVIIISFMITFISGGAFAAEEVSSRRSWQISCGSFVKDMGFDVSLRIYSLIKILSKEKDVVFLNEIF